MTEAQDKKEYLPRIWAPLDVGLEEHGFWIFEAANEMTPNDFPLPYLSLEESDALLAAKDAEIVALKSKLAANRKAFEEIIEHERFYGINQGLSSDVVAEVALKATEDDESNNKKETK